MPFPVTGAMNRAGRLALFAVLLSGCATAPTPIPSSITLSVTSVAFDAVGETRQITATVLDQWEQPLEASITWSSNAAAITLTPSKSAVTLTAQSAGSAIVTAAAGAVQATVSVAVVPVPVAPVKLSGDLQSGVVGLPLGAPVEVRVLDRLGVPIAGQAVTFSVAQGGGAVTQSAVISGVDGIASTQWTLGSGAGSSHLLVVALPNGLSTWFTASALPGAPTQLIVGAGQGQEATVGTAVATAPAVVVRDQFGNPVPAILVAFTVTGGQGSLQGATPSSSTSGVATVGSWTLGQLAGPNTLTASLPGGSPVVFAATGRAGPPMSLAVQAGQGQTAPAGSMVPVAPSVRIQDQFGNPVAGVTVIFAITGGGGTLTGAIAITGPDGTAQAGSWILGPSAGPNTLTAGAAGLPEVLFTATASGGAAAASVVLSTGQFGVAVPGTATLTPPAVVVRNASGLGVSGVTVNFAITRGTGSLSGASVVTNASGVATVGGWILGSGANCLTATVAAPGISGNPVSFVATGIPASGPGYEVSVQYLSCVTAPQEAAFVSAVARWSTIITGDVVDLAGLTFSPGLCGTNAPALVNRTVDDLLIFATIEPIDGPGRILGSAGPCFIRVANNLPVIGLMRFDVADIDALEAGGQLTSVILHEMGHVIGIGSMWNNFGLLQQASPVGGPARDTYHNGAGAIAGFDAIGGATYTQGNKVPVENMYSSGTINSHWRESVLGSELMTGFLNSNSANPLSLLTVRSLADFGYQINLSAADPFFLTLSLRVDPAPEVLIRLQDDVFTGPLYTIDAQGRMLRIR